MVLCRKCTDLFLGRIKRRKDSTTFVSRYNHHARISIIEDVARSCFICKELIEKVLKLRSSGQLDNRDQRDIVASIRQVAPNDRRRDLFHVEYKIELKEPSKPGKHFGLASFILVGIGEVLDVLYRTPAC